MATDTRRNGYVGNYPKQTNNYTPSTRDTAQINNNNINSGISPEWAAYKTIVDTISAMNLNSVEAEVIKFMQDRPMRQMHKIKKTGKPSDIVDLIHAMEFESQGRTRMVEILNRINKQRANLDVALTAVGEWLLVTILANEKLTITEKKATVRIKLKRGFKLKSDLDSLAESIILSIQDVDKAGYNFRNIVDLIKTVSESKFNRIV